jgi:cytochrome c-type biogenesis protein
VEQVTLLTAFAAGFLSFVSPCVLPLIPGYLSFVSGLTLEEMRGGAAGNSGARRQVLMASTAFVLGFSTVFIALGASASAIGDFLMSRLPLLGKIAGVLIIIFGLHTMGVFRLRFLETEKRIHTSRKPAGLVGAFLVGIAFAFGWTPCIGPILGGILTIAKASGKASACWRSTRSASEFRSCSRHSPSTGSSRPRHGFGGTTTPSRWFRARCSSRSAF